MERHLALLKLTIKDVYSEQIDRKKEENGTVRGENINCLPG